MGLPTLVEVGVLQFGPVSSSCNAAESAADALLSVVMGGAVFVIKALFETSGVRACRSGAWPKDSWIVPTGASIAMKRQALVFIAECWTGAAHSESEKL